MLVSKKTAFFLKYFTGALTAGMTYHLVFVNPYEQYGDRDNVFTPVRCVPTTLTRCSALDNDASLTPVARLHAQAVIAVEIEELLVGLCPLHELIDGHGLGLLRHEKAHGDGQTGASRVPGGRLSLGGPGTSSPSSMTGVGPGRAASWRAHAGHLPPRAAPEVLPWAQSCDTGRV